MYFQHHWSPAESSYPPTPLFLHWNLKKLFLNKKIKAPLFCSSLQMLVHRSSRVSETTVMYSARLTSLSKMYVESRKVTDFETLMSLIVCDRIKSTLKDGCLWYVLSVEASHHCHHNMTIVRSKYAFINYLQYVQTNTNVTICES